MSDTTNTSAAVAAYLKDKQTQDTATQARMGFMLGSQANPDYEAELRKVAAATGVPVESARANPEAVKQQAQMRTLDFGQLAQKFPRTAGFLTGVEDAKLAHDDAENMGLVETMLNSFKRGWPALKALPDNLQVVNQAGWIKTFGDIDKRLAAGEDPKAVLNDYGNIGMAPLPWFDSKQALASYQATKAKVLPRVQQTLSESAASAAALNIERSKIPAPPVVEKVMRAKTFGEAWAAIKTDPVRFIAAIGPESLVQSAPGLLAAVPAGIALGPAGAVGAIGTGSMVTDYSASVMEVLQSSGVNTTDPEAIKAALKNPEILTKVVEQSGKHAAVVGAFDALSAGLASKTLLPKAVADRIASPVLREVAAIGVQLPVQAAMGAAGEAGGELAAGQELQPGQILAEAAGEMFGAPTEVVSVAGTQIRERVQKAQQAEAAAAQLEQLGKAAQASKLLARDADTFERFVAQAAEGSEVQDVYIDAKDLMQSGMAEQVAAVSPSVAGQLQEALATGGTLRIPVAEYTARIAGTELNQSLIDHLKVEPEGMSRAQAKEFMQTQGEELRAEVERVMAEKQGNAEFKASAEVVKGQVLEQLNRVARFSPEVNGAYATMMGNFYAVAAAKLGITPEEMAQRFPITVAAEGVTGGPVLQQGGQDQRNLIVAHNLNADNLRNALEIGGLPAPSLAITRADAPIQGFGEISLVGDKGMATPSAKNPIYNADVYSPRFPSVKVKVNTAAVEGSLSPLAEAARGAGVYATEPARVAEELARNRLGDAVRYVTGDLGLRYGYATKVLGANIQVPMKAQQAMDTRPTKGSLVTQEPLASLLASMPDFGKTVTVGTPESQAIAQKLYVAMVNRFIGEEAEKGKGDGVAAGVELANRRIKLFTEGEGETTDLGDGVTMREPQDMTNEGLLKIWRLWRDHQARQAQGTEPAAPAQPKQAVDTAALDAKLSEVIDEEKMRQWVREQLAPAMGEKRIAKENGRTAEYTLANLVKEMTRAVRDAEGFNYGLGNARSRGATRFKNLKEIQGRRDQVQAKADADAAIAKNEERFQELVDKLGKYLPSQSSSYGRRTWEALPEVIGESYTLGLERALEENGFEGVPTELVDELKQFAQDLLNLPTEYFEAKPQRAVGIGEFRGAVIPSNAAADVRDALANMGLTLAEYEKGNEQSRAEAVRKLAAELDAANGDVLFQRQQAQGNRGMFNPATSTITLLKAADLSTFLHESGHFFLEVQLKLAEQLMAQAAEGNVLSEGERSIVGDAEALLKWFGVESLAEWRSLDFEEMRSYHEKFARGFEAYLFEGRAPSIELQGVFQRFRAWLLNIYRDIKNLNVQLTDEVRQVFDRMMATNEEIMLAEKGRSMLALFSTAEQMGVSPEEFARYQALGVDATNEAIQDLQARTLRGLAWARNARGREIKRLQREAKDKRAEVEMDARREVMSQPVYRAWQFLTARISAADKITPRVRAKSDPKKVDPAIDSLHAAIAKLGGLRKDEVVGQWGVDPKEKAQSGVFGKPVLRRDGGLSIDAMAERLGELGYLPQDENGRVGIRDFEERFDSELRGSPVYSVVHDYSQAQGEARAGEGLNLEALSAGRFDIAELKAMGLPQEVVNAIEARKMTAKEGIHPDIVAELFGFTSGDELARALAQADDPKVAIEALADLRMLERHGELATPEAIERAADVAIHNEARGRMIATEANALAKAAGKRTVMASAAREFARAAIARLKVRDIRPGQYAAAEVRAAKAAASASAKGDTAQAAAEKRNQLLSTYLTRAAYDAQDEVKKAVEYLKKFDTEAPRKGLDADYLDQIDTLLERFDLRTGQSLKAIDKRTTLAEWVESQREMGLEPDVPAELLNEASRKSYKDMTVEELRGLTDAVKQIEHLGRLKKRLLTAKDQREYEAIRDEMAASITANAGDRQADTRTPITNTGRAVQGLKRFWAAHIKTATYARVMDGGKDGGPVWEYIIRPANERGDMETRMRAEATLRLSEILAPVFKLGKMGGKGQFFPSINRSLNREARIAIALNMGNEGNAQRLLGGEGWTMEQVMPVLQSLTSAEWQAVQAIWDHFESYRPEIAAKERRVYGKEPTWVEPRALDVRTADGQELTLRGGYYPIKYDPQASQRAEEHADAEGAKRQLQGAYTSATTRRSFTKSRVEEVSGRPLLYTLSGLYSGVNDVIHDLAWHEWLIDANRLMRSKTIDAAIRNHYGPEAKAQFKSWIADIAEGDQGAANAAEAALSRLRQGVSVAGLGFNVMSALMQPLGITQSIVRVGATWVGRGVAQYLANPVRAAREVNAKSEFMASRARTRFRELNELRNQVQDESATKRVLSQGAYFLMMRFQQMVDTPTWLGAYEKAIAEGNDEARAISLADQAVIDAQGGGQTKDLAAIERGGPALKLFTVFYSFMNTALNLGVQQTMTANTPAKKAKLAADMLLLYVVPPVLGYILKQAATPGDDDLDDPEKLAKSLAANQLDYLMGLMVVVREFAEAAKLVTGANDKGRDYQGPAGLRVIADTGSMAKQVHQGEFDDAFRKAAINLLGGVLGLPAAQINRTITGVQAINEGKTTNPAAVAFGYQEKK